MKSSDAHSKIVSFPVSSSSLRSEYERTQSNIIMKTTSSNPTLSDAFGMEILKAARMQGAREEMTFRVILKNDQPRQALLCGLVSEDYRKGIAIAIEPGSGAILDVLNGAGPLGYLESSYLFPNQPIRVELRLQRFGRNHISSVFVEGQAVMYPAFLAGEDLIFNAIVGGDVRSGCAVDYREPMLTQGSFARVA